MHDCQYISSYIGSSTLGENFNPAKDCADIVDNLPEAKDGFYWIKHTKGKPLKVKTIYTIRHHAVRLSYLYIDRLTKILVTCFQILNLGS